LYNRDAIFLRDLESFLSQYYKGLEAASKSISEALSDGELVIFIKLFILLYADDTVVMAEDPLELQKALDAMHAYCTKNKLTVNISKTKVIIFARGKVRKFPKFMYGGQTLEVTDDYTYLGVVFNYNGRFNKAIAKQQTQATRAMYAVLNKSKKLCLPVDIQIQLFDAMVKLILLYGSEVWGFQNLEIIEKVHLKFMKIILSLNKSTSSCMVYGELGRYPLKYSINTRMISYWGRLLTGKENKLSVVLYKTMLKQSSNNVESYQWLDKVKSILNECGLSYVWENQTFSSLSWLKHSVQQISQDQYKQNWHSDVTEGRKCLNYRIFKTKFILEPYLLSLPENLRRKMSKFRCRNVKIPIELGAHRNIPREDRKCTLCELDELGDEYHYVFMCPFFTKERHNFVKKYFWDKPSAPKLCELLNSKGKNLRNIGKFIAAIMDKFNSKIKEI
jgi:hypothetical protein